MHNNGQKLWEIKQIKRLKIGQNWKDWKVKIGQNWKVKIGQNWNQMYNSRLFGGVKMLIGIVKCKDNW